MKNWQRYPEYKDSGVEWLGEIPKHWEVWKLSHAFQKIGSGTTPLTNHPDYYDGDIPWVNTSELRENVITNTNVKLTEKALLDHSVLNLYSPGTLLVAMYGATIGRLGILGITACTNQACCALANSKSLNTKFTFYWLWMRKNELIILASGGGQPNINQEKIRSIRIPAPPLPEQKAIAHFLDRETSKLDKLIAKKERFIELLQEKRTALISHAVTKGLNPDIPMKDSGISWLGQIPKHWEICQLRRIVNKFVDYRGATPEKVSQGIPLITARNIKNGTIDFSVSQEFIKEQDYNSWMVRGFPKIGDVIVTTEAPLGESAQIIDENIALAQRVILLKSRTSQVNNDYLKYHFVSQFGQAELWSKATGSTALGIKASHFKATLVLVPPLSEQKAIAHFLDQETAKIDTLIEKTKTSIEKLKEYRTALISAAVTGKIDIREEI